MGKKLLAAAIAAGATYAGISFLTFYEVTKKNARIPGYATKIFNKKHGIGGEGKPDERVEWFRAQDRDTFEIVNSRGQNIRAYLIPADEPSDKFIVCSHGYRNRGQGEFRFVGKFLHDSGYNVFFVDHQAAGESEGNYISFGHYESEDLLQWVNFIVDKFAKDVKIALYGISMGSATVMLMSNNENLPENVKHIVADCGYTSVNDEFNFTLDTFGVPGKPLIFMANQFSKVIGKWDFDKVNPIDAVKDAKVPMLFIHGENDDFVPSFMGCKLYNACGNEKDYLTVPGAGHAQSYQTNSELYEAKMTDFFGKYFK